MGFGDDSKKKAFYKKPIGELPEDITQVKLRPGKYRVVVYGGRQQQKMQSNTVDNAVYVKESDNQ